MQSLLSNNLKAEVKEVRPLAINRHCVNQLWQQHVCLHCRLCTSFDAGSWQGGQWDHPSTRLEIMLTRMEIMLTRMEIMLTRMEIMLMTTFLTDREVLYCQFWGCDKPPFHQSRCAYTHYNKVLPLFPLSLMYTVQFCTGLCSHFVCKSLFHSQCIHDRLAQAFCNCLC